MSVELEQPKAHIEEASAPLADLPTLDLLARPNFSNRQVSSSLLSPLMSDRQDAGQQKSLQLGDPFKLSFDLAAAPRAQAAAPPKSEQGSLKLSNPYDNCVRPACPFDDPSQPRANDLSKIPSLKEQLAELQLKLTPKTEATDAAAAAAKGATEKKAEAEQKAPADAKAPAELKPAADAKPATDAKTQPNDKAQPQESKQVGPNAVQNYEQRQGGRTAGSNVAPALDFGPRTVPSNTIPNPNQQADYRPKPSQPQDSFTPFRPGDNRPVVPANTQPRDGTTFIPDANVQPAEHRTDANDHLVDKTRMKFGTSDAAKAIATAKALGVPLAVHIGASWCKPCRDMERLAWPQIEGDGPHSMKGKVVTLHVDIDEASSLASNHVRPKETAEQKVARQEATKAINSVATDPEGYPTLRVYTFANGTPTMTIQESGGKGAADLKRFLIQGGVK